MEIEKTYSRDDWGHNSHTMDDIFVVLRAIGHEELFNEMGRNHFLHIGNGADASILDWIASCLTLCIELNGGLKVYLKRPPVWKPTIYEYNVFSLERVEARTMDDIDQFAASLEELEAKRARQILSLWESKGWQADGLRELTNRQIMVVDGVVGMDSAEGILDFVEVKRAFEGENESVIEFLATKRKTFRFPSQECTERISETFGPFEFTTVAGARIARDVWNAFRNNTEVLDCLILGLHSGGHIRQRPDWPDWRSHHSLELLLEEASAEGKALQDVLYSEPPRAVTGNLVLMMNINDEKDEWELVSSFTP